MKRSAKLATGVVFLLAAAFQASNAKAQDAAAPCPRDVRPEAQGMPSEDRIFSWIEDLTKIGKRLTGTPGGEKAAAYVKCQFEALGLQDVRYEKATSWLWQADKSSFSVNGRPIDSFPVNYSFVTPDQPSVFSTGPGGLQAPIVDVGDGNAWAIRTRDVKGKIVVFDLKFEVSTVAFLPFVDFLWDPKLTLLEPSIFAANPYLTNLSRVVKRLQEAGAAGFVGVLSDYYDSNRYHNEYYRRSQMTIPGVWVTKSDGQLLREQLRKAGKGAQANLVLEGSRTEVEARAVVGVLPGRSHETILMTSHHDSVSAGAVEDASGVGALLAQLQIAASKPAAEREKTMLFATMDSHFTGYQVHQAFADKYITRQATPYKLVAGITLEHIARQGVIKNGQLEMRDQPELMGIMNNFSYGVRRQLKRSIIKNDLRRSATLKAGLLCKTFGLPTDASFTCVAGLPTASLIAAPIYLYDEDDTLDKVAKDQLIPVTKVFADLVDVLDRTPADQIGQ